MNYLIMVICLLFLSCMVEGMAQVNEDISAIPVLENEDGIHLNIEKNLKRKGNFFFYWGYNRSAYTKSDIHFWGDGYDFTITNVKAKDEPTHDFITYIKPNSFTRS